MNQMFLKSLILLIFFSLNSFSTDSIRTDQIVMGTEPARTNYVLMFDSVKSIFRKIFLGKGSGVLDAQTKTILGSQQKYLDLLKSRCKDCIFDVIRESHGFISYKVTFPDGFYIVSSVDAGGLEWQTKPVSVNSFQNFEDKIQRYVYDLTAEIGISGQFDGMGGHISVSGYGGDSFWVANLFKLKAKYYDTDWGFWAQDSYNANIVARFEDSQRLKYESILKDHDKSWKDFLIGLEDLLIKDSSNLDSIIEYFDSRKTMNVKSLMSSLLKTYHNPRQEIPLLGMRSKNKYVASRPDTKREMIENRAIRPQKNSNELSLLGRFFEAQAWYVKEKISEGQELSAKIDKYQKKSRNDLLSNVFQEISEYGLDWEDYKVFSKTKIKKTENELFNKPFNLNFQEASYGAKKRDDLFKGLLNSSLGLKNLSEKQIVFISKLINEMSYTSKEVQNNFKKFSTRFPVKVFDELNASTKISVLEEFASMGARFKNIDGKIGGIKKYYNSIITKNFHDQSLNGILDGFVKNLSKDDFNEFYYRFEKRFNAQPNAQFISNFEHLFKFKIEGKQEISGNLVDTFELFMKKNIENPSRVVSPELTDIILSMSNFPNSHSTSIEFSKEIMENIAKGTTLASNDSFKLFELLSNDKSLSESSKQKVSRNFKNLFLKNIKEKKYGVNDFYSVKVYIENLFQITDVQEHHGLLNKLIPQIEQAYTETLKAGPHSGKSSPVDLKLLLKDLRGREKNHCLYFL